ncbi:hypothetical protein KIH39_18060 [Telmatocola sphagniphila]|uniref:Uncharacterized protein n=1 Tax=Telmatocola sphagniphila TaxID=1123043 RepID=A0A8E6B2K4_9BACT|nr:hypothetical protein [Telmatocola sphagniphila]QVL30748.1 hypothetical protein KIH39_18060 [Telmatocola sphagniphila]
MLAKAKLQAAAFIGFGMMLGYATATGNLNPISWAKGNPPEVTQTANSGTDPKASTLVALANHNERVSLQAEKTGKKPKTF